MEEASLRALFTTPRHPYTKGLLNAIPKLGRSRGAGITRLAEIPGRVPILRGPSVGCVFAGRCPRADVLCRTTEPKLKSFGPEHIAACHHAREELATA